MEKGVVESLGIQNSRTDCLGLWKVVEEVVGKNQKSFRLSYFLQQDSSQP